MRFMNTYEIEGARVRYRDHPVLGPATKTLASLRDAADRNSDGWCYWPKPARAAARLMELIERDGTAHWRFDEEREDATVAELRKAYAPIKAFRTRTGVQFDIYEPMGVASEAATSSATYEQAIEAAAGLIEDGGNAEYVRGIAEVIADTFGYRGARDMEEAKTRIALDLGLPPTAIT